MNGREELVQEDSGMPVLGPVDDGGRADAAGVDDSAGVDLNCEWQNRPRPWEYDDPEQYRIDLERFMSRVVWPE